MNQRRLGLEQTRHGQAFSMHFMYEFLNRGTRMHTLRAEGWSFDLLLGKVLTMCHRRENAG